ncbi:MAG: hypothetical protein JW959_03635 [Pirellulales bacterium]|nr:hypothetical protein [Pirellulales bacterium]
MRSTWRNRRGVIAAIACLFSSFAAAEQPPTIDPFGPKTERRDDALPGRIELSDGSSRSGAIHLTRDKCLTIYDERFQRQREIPLAAIARIDCKIEKEWMEREWKFKETTSDEKIYTGRTYPVRKYLHTITLRDDRTITGPLSALVYLRPKPESPGEETKPLRFILHKRHKGKVGEELKSLVYVKRIEFGDEKKQEKADE